MGHAVESLWVWISTDVISLAILTPRVRARVRVDCLGQAERVQFRPGACRSSRIASDSTPMRPSGIVADSELYGCGLGVVWLFVGVLLPFVLYRMAGDSVMLGCVLGDV